MLNQGDISELNWPNIFLFTLSMPTMLFGEGEEKFVNGRVRHAKDFILDPNYESVFSTPSPCPIHLKR